MINQPIHLLDWKTRDIFSSVDQKFFPLSHWPMVKGVHKYPLILLFFTLFHFAIHWCKMFQPYQSAMPQTHVTLNNCLNTDTRAPSDLKTCKWSPQFHCPRKQYKYSGKQHMDCIKLCLPKEKKTVYWLNTQVSNYIWIGFATSSSLTTFFEK